MSTSLFGIFLAVALPVFGASRIWPVNRRLQQRLATPRLDEVPFTPDAVMIDNLVSLAVASSMAADATSGRWRRRIAAVIGTIGVFGWAGAAAAGAGVGLASTGNLPDPVQRVVADVLEVVNIEVPRPISSTVIAPSDRDDDTDSDTDDGATDDSSNGGTDDADAAGNGGDGTSNSGGADNIAGADGVRGDDDEPAEVAPVEEDPTSTSTTPSRGTTTTVRLPAGLDSDDLPPGLDDDDLPPGLSGDTPAGTAPGRENNNGNDNVDDDSPGNSGNTPGNTAPGRNSDNDDDADDNDNVDDEDDDSTSSNTTTTTIPWESWNPVYPGNPGNSGNTPGNTAPGRSNGNVDDDDDDDDDDTVDDDDDDDNSDNESPGNSGNAPGRR